MDTNEPRDVVNLLQLLVRIGVVPTDPLMLLLTYGPPLYRYRARLTEQPSAGEILLQLARRNSLDHAARKNP